MGLGVGVAFSRLALPSSPPVIGQLPHVRLAQRELHDPQPSTAKNCCGLFSRERDLQNSEFRDHRGTGGQRRRAAHPRPSGIVPLGLSRRLQFLPAISECHQVNTSFRPALPIEPYVPDLGIRPFNLPFLAGPCSEKMSSNPIPRAPRRCLLIPYHEAGRWWRKVRSAQELLPGAGLCS